MRQDEVVKLFEQIGVMKKGHFRLSSGRHSDTYLQCASLQQYPQHNAVICNIIADQIRSFQPTLIIGAAVGGIISCYELARQLNARCIFAERDQGELVFRRSFYIKPTDRIIVVEDVVTTGKTTKELLALIEKYHVSPLALCSLVDRSMGKVEFSHPLFSVLKVEAHTWEPDVCPLCESGMELTQPGSRHLHK
ncbi:MAG: orotate phosphoribosyltransferase [Caldisericia bacterium]|nr:orotate phosphoribosyltransferase [Caldisericia bacterium]